MVLGAFAGGCPGGGKYGHKTGGQMQLHTNPAPPPGTCGGAATGGVGPPIGLTGGRNISTTYFTSPTKMTKLTQETHSKHDGNQIHYHFPIFLVPP